MGSDKLRRQITFEAARLMYLRQEEEYFRAKLKAAQNLCRGWVPASQLPSNAEIRDELQRFVWLHEGHHRNSQLREMRLVAWQMLLLLQRFQPRLIGSTLTGHVRAGSDIDLHVFSDSVAAVTQTLDAAQLPYLLERKEVHQAGASQTYTHLHVQARFPVELTVYSFAQRQMTFRSSITGKPIEAASLRQFRQLLQQAYPGIDLSEQPLCSGELTARFEYFRSLLQPLARVEQSRKYHPEGDVLYHSLQVYLLAQDAAPWDLEFLLAALLHDVGKGIDSRDHVRSGLQALEGRITPRTAWLIEHHMEMHKYREGTLGARALRRLTEHPDFETLQLLGECDLGGRVPGVSVPELDEVLAELLELSRSSEAESE
jgi:hypothetical protein